MEDIGSSKKLGDFINNIEKYRRLKLIGFVLTPIVIGFFILRYCNIKLNELEKEIRVEIQQEMEEIRITHRNVIIDDTYLIYSKRTDLLNYYDARIRWITQLSSYKNCFSSGLIGLIEESEKEISCIRLKIDNFNKEFVKRRKNEYQYLFDKVPFPLDENQKNAIIIDDKHNLVVAGAGSGKTEVLINRIAYLIERKPDTVNRKKILALAFQRDAARQMKNRLKERYNLDVEIRTFHSLGLNILKEIDERYKLYGGDNHEQKSIQLISKLVNDAKKEREFQNHLINYMKWVGTSEKTKDEADFKEKEEFYEYMRNLELTALDETKVKSHGELEIINFFLTNKINNKNIKVLYEDYAEWMEYEDPDKLKHTPRPDFYLPDYDVYIEHWAIDDDGSTWENDYLRTMKIKKKKFAEHNKTLIETTYGEFKNNKNFIELLKERLLKILHEKYPDKDFTITPIEYEELVKKVWDECKVYIDNLPKHIANYIKNAKTYYLTPEKISERLSKEKWNREQITFSQVALKIYEDYQNELKSSGYIDFEDMINIAIESLKNSPELLKDNYDHILVDEYQDISQQRYELIKTIVEKNQNCKLFCVGDDWQSIMSFAGSNPEFFINFDKYFDHPARTDLTFNYRSIKSIVETGNEIIKYNGDQQISKKVYANNEQIVPIDVFYLMHKENYKWKYYKQMVEDCIDRIKYHLDNGYESEDIMVLTRITKNPIYKEFFYEYVNNNNISFSSIHKSKGLQSKIVFLLDMKEGVYGFPCQLHNPVIFEPARMEVISDKVVEERRLFYVAVTRAKEKLYVYSQKSNPSRFLSEMGEYVNHQNIGY